uniref:Tetratricopeptide repeat protein 24 n=1 Tax=Pogona vitticeps TaxID=103695 RepID=A0ABM5F403_9SAUR
MALEDTSALDAGLIQEGGSGQAPRGSVKKKRKNSKKSKAETSAEETEKREHEEASPRRDTDIEGLTAAGHRALLRGDTKKALACFKRAFVLSEGTASEQARRVCAFNLGAAYVEAGKPKKGLDVLLRSLPGEGEDAAEPTGDLFFNVGAAHAGLGDYAKALESFRQAQARYRSVQAGCDASTSVKMGYCYLGLEDPSRAASCFLEAGRAYEEAGSPERAATALCQAASLMGQSGRHGPGEVVRVLDECRQLCEQIANRALLGKLYNDIGLCFSQLKIFSLAAESFERALPFCQNGEEEAAVQDRGKEAAVLQNLGAAQNMLGNFSKALGFHQRAAALHSALGNRRAQGQCFCNMAFAFSQLGDHEAAEENYLHALQAFKDAGDLQGQRQACEGLGASRFHLGDPERAVLHYKEALRLFSPCPDASDPAQERIVNKLTDALQSKLSWNSRIFHGGARTPSAPMKQLPGSHPASQVRFAVSLQHKNESFPPMACRASDSSVGQEDHQNQRSAPVQSLSHGLLHWGDLVAPQIPSPKPKYRGASAQIGAPGIPNGDAALLGKSTEDTRGPSAFPDFHKQGQESSHLNAFLYPDPLHQNCLQSRKACHAQTCQQERGAVQPRTRTLQRAPGPPVCVSDRHLEPRQLGWKEKLKSVVCALM